MTASDKLPLGILLSDNMLRLIPILENAFAAAGLNINCAQYRLLTYLATDKARILNDVAEFFSRDKSMMLRYLDHLENCGYIQRQPHPHDGRRKCLNLTTSGRQALTRAKKVEQKLYDTLLKGCGANDKNAFYHVLLRIAENVPVLE